jgi:hypothetical protein
LFFKQFSPVRPPPFGNGRHSRECLDFDKNRIISEILNLEMHMGDTVRQSLKYNPFQ